jgi:hypothetical protein
MDFRDDEFNRCGTKICDLEMERKKIATFQKLRNYVAKRNHSKSTLTIIYKFEFKFFDCVCFCFFCKRAKSGKLDSDTNISLTDFSRSLGKRRRNLSLFESSGAVRCTF